MMYRNTSAFIELIKASANLLSSSLLFHLVYKIVTCFSNPEIFLINSTY